MIYLPIVTVFVILLIMIYVTKKHRNDEAKITMASAEIAMIPQTTTQLTDPEDVKKMDKLLELLEDDDDVQDIFHNYEEE